MSSDDLANYAFSYVLVGAVVWALIYRPIAPGPSPASRIAATLGVIVAWPVIVIEIVRGLIRRAR